MIYISSSCVKFNKISESVEFLASHGFKHIELSGGTNNYSNIKNDLLELKEKYDLSYLIHNYFPPPEKHFVLNMASLNDQIFSETINHYQKAINLAKKIGAKKYGLHAGFFIDPSVNDLGKKIGKSAISNKDDAIKQFCKGFNILNNQSGSIKLYVENNVISASNYKSYNQNIFMLTNSSEYTMLKEDITFNLLLDLGHLKVSCKTLGLNFEEEFETLWNQTDYIHLSNNDGSHDTNQAISSNSDIYNFLKKENLTGKTFSLEIYNNLDDLRNTYQLITKLL
ncbi:MAG: TIM barrel protein [Bacteroidales bacterium]|nr:TIM barrel protein [Bacteroidales bacterium]